MNDQRKDRHKRPNRTIRLPEDLEKQAGAMAAELGESFNAFVTEAVRQRVRGHTTNDDMTAIRLGGRRPGTAATRRPLGDPAERKPLGYSKEQQTRGKR